MGGRCKPFKHAGNTSRKNHIVSGPLKLYGKAVAYAQADIFNADFVAVYTSLSQIKAVHSPDCLRRAALSPSCL